VALVVFARGLEQLRGVVELEPTLATGRWRGKRQARGQVVHIATLEPEPEHGSESGCYASSGGGILRGDRVDEPLHRPRVERVGGQR
jgi:hypothetical protein